ncbi:hypothetical protein LQ384_17880 [Rhodococcus rhodochrous]|uniref:Uncharacterized protein n=1 Tax=Rhodococcus rhodochrous TaxID=1829 RepID=A0AAW4XII2_RHORH|nr:hypothetical protein [Rhodococcus rhodochrous]MCD2112985.1 hypothetical protein [Rhodococcus rhodochrous]
MIQENGVTEESDAAKMQCQCIFDWGSMSERLLGDHTADTIQFQRVDAGTLRRHARASVGPGVDGADRLRSSAGHPASKRVVFKERNGPNLWLITAIVALTAAVALFAGGVAVNQARDSTPAYQSVYIPENVLGGSQK